MWRACILRSASISLDSWRHSISELAVSRSAERFRAAASSSACNVTINDPKQNKIKHKTETETRNQSAAHSVCLARLGAALGVGAGPCQGGQSKSLCVGCCFGSWELVVREGGRLYERHQLGPLRHHFGAVSLQISSNAALKCNLRMSPHLLALVVRDGGGLDERHHLCPLRQPVSLRLAQHIVKQQPLPPQTVNFCPATQTCRMFWTSTSCVLVSAALRIHLHMSCEPNHFRCRPLTFVLMRGSSLEALQASEPRAA